MTTESPNPTPTPIPHDLLAGTTAGPWVYRPDKYDDWGVVRAGRFWICQAKNPSVAGDDEILNEHRRARTDPYEANARLIAAAPDLAAENARQANTIMEMAFEARAKDAELAAMREALASVETLAKTMRNAEKLVGPENAAERRVWVKTRYADGRALIEIIRAARAKVAS